jgi:predicted nucleic acid-binding protein
VLYSQGFGVADAAHVAFAEQLADVFIACDDKLLKKCRKASLKIGKPKCNTNYDKFYIP